MLLFVMKCVLIFFELLGKIENKFWLIKYGRKLLVVKRIMIMKKVFCYKIFLSNGIKIIINILL